MSQSHFIFVSVVVELNCCWNFLRVCQIHVWEVVHVREFFVEWYKTLQSLYAIDLAYPDLSFGSAKVFKVVNPNTFMKCVIVHVLSFMRWGELHFYHSGVVAVASCLEYWGFKLCTNEILNLERTDMALSWIRIYRVFSEFGSELNSDYESWRYRWVSSEAALDRPAKDVLCAPCDLGILFVPWRK